MCLFLINLTLVQLHCYCCVNNDHNLISVLLVPVLLGHIIFCNDAVFVYHIKFCSVHKH